MKEALESKKDAIKDAWARNLISGTAGEKLMFELEEHLTILSKEEVVSAPRTHVEILKDVTKEREPMERN